MDQWKNFKNRDGFESHGLVRCFNHNDEKKRSWISWSKLVFHTNHLMPQVIRKPGAYSNGYARSYPVMGTQNQEEIWVKMAWVFCPDKIEIICVILSLILRIWEESPPVITLPHLDGELGSSYQETTVIRQNNSFLNVNVADRLLAL